MNNADEVLEFQAFSPASGGRQAELTGVPGEIFHTSLDSSIPDL
jgi:hypothetical protein